MKDDLREALELAVIEGASGIFYCDVKTMTQEEISQKVIL